MRYDLSDLILNLNAGALADRLGPRSECNPGGSTICWSPTKGCGSGGMTCVTTSTSFETIEMQVSLPPDELQALQAEIAEVVQKFAGRKK